ncbi:hypothetical protein ACOSZH_16420 [Priestia megaterium]|uniref:hypothetical protein n=1 Tax=Priestia megaterium TaxID=1404 RepID=UPI003BA23E68
MRNRYMYWHKGENIADTTVDELEKRMRAEQEELKPLSKEELCKQKKSKPVKGCSFMGNAYFL